MTRSLVTALCLLVPVLADAQPSMPWSVSSPDGRTSIAVTRGADGRLSWTATRGRAQVIAPSPLGIARADQRFIEGLIFVAASAVQVVDEKYTMPHGKRREHSVRGRARTLTFANAAGAKVEIVLRAHDDGVAFRYRFPETDATLRTVVEEQTGFHVPDGAKAWLMPQQPVHRYGPAYEEFYNEVAVRASAPAADGWSLPALFGTQAGQWLLLHEAALDGEYCGSHLAQTSSDGVYRVKFPDPKEGMGVGEVNPSSTLPWTMPWRLVIIGDSAGQVLESDLVLDLSPPSRVTDTSWVTPGRAAWSWWSARDSPKHAAVLNAFIDMGAEMGWEYALVDANWNFMETGRIDDVVAHARKQGVGLLLWYNSGGPHNDVTEAPRDRMHTREARRAEFARLKEWGVKGVKVDFWHSDKQDRIRQYRAILEDAADFQIMVNFHGSTIPRGWSREFPHLMTMEAVFGAEQYKFRDAFATRAAWLNTVLPFTRNVVGPMDYTPVAFTDQKFPRRTTNAHELALAVVFESGIQHFADSVEAYRGLPDAPKALLKSVPAAWDATRALVAEPGEAVVVARRAGESWYVGGLNGGEDARPVTVSLTFLGPGQWMAAIVRDGNADRTFADETRRVTLKDSIDVPMRARGGFVIRLTRASGGTP